MYFTQLPPAIDANVRALCHRIGPDSSPVYLNIEPEIDAEPLDCFYNVRRKIARDVGSIVFGWALWTWPRVLLEAEHHAVFQDEAGLLHDITPGQVVEHTRRLFLRDDRATYDFENEGILRDNIRMPLGSDPLIKQFMGVAEQRTRIMNAIPGVGTVKVDGATAAELNRIDLAKVSLQLQIALKNMGPNDRCFCGSGKKFKHCHRGFDPLGYPLA